MKILVTAGPTYEPIDPVRFIGNRSSGKMGYALARRAAGRGHEVILVSGPVALDAPDNVILIRAETAEKMLRVVQERVTWCDTLIMAAAVADWRPGRIETNKIKKENASMILQLEPTADILKTVAQWKKGRIFVGFAAETQNLEKEAIKKMKSRRLDLVVANDVGESGSGFEVDTNRVTLIEADGTIKSLPLMTKDKVAERIVKWVEKRAAAKTIQPA